MTDGLLDRLAAALGNRYRVERELGRGGMATVFKAIDEKHGRAVAVKVLHPGLEAIGGAERFQREIEIAANLSHPNVLALLDSGSADGLRYYIMPFVDGESLRQRLDREHQLSLSEALRIARAVGAGLASAHQRGLVHRDIKPENILLAGDQVLVADFGIARMAAANENLTATGFSLGTPNYMSPEQSMASRQVDPRSDLYSLACVLYEMIAGHPPFMGTSWQEVMGRHAVDSVPPLRSARPTVPASLERAIERALAKAPADRFATVGDFLAAFPSDAEVERSATGVGARLEPVSSRRWWWVTAAAVGALAVIAAILLLRPTRGAEGTANGRILMAVLPLVNKGDAADEYFADGLTEEIATRLARVRGIGVIARNNRIERTATEKSPEDIGKRLGVRYVLDGAVWWAGTGLARQVKITAQLIEVATGLSVWGQPYQEALSDVFELQRRVAQRVVEGLAVQLGDSEKVALRESSTQNQEAYRLYALGRFHWKKRTAEGLTQAVDAFDRALALDPKYARARAGLADAYILFPQYGVAAISGAEAFRKARVAATAALELDPGLAEAQASLGEIATYADWDWEEAGRRLSRAIELDPGYATAHHWYAELLTITGRFEAARAEADSAMQLDPTSAVIAHAAAHPLMAMHRYGEAVAGYQKVLERDPAFGYAHYGLIWSEVLAGHGARAESLLARFGDTTALMRTWVRVAIDSSRRNEAVALAARSAAALAALPPLLRAPWFAGVGMDRQAIEVLEMAADQHDIAALGVKSIPLYDRLRRDPRFIALLARLRLPPDSLSAATR